MATDRAVPRDADEFGAWVRPHLMAMKHLAVRLAPTGDHDDIVQEALLRAWLRRSTFDPDRGSVQTWLLAIVTDRARRIRRRARSVLRLVDERNGSVAGAQPDPVDPALDIAVRQLPRRQRMVIELYYFLGLPVAECAAVLGIAEGTVKSTLSDARSRLRALLEVTE